MSARPDHYPVMLEEVLEALQPADGAVFVDATFGAGGYSRALLEAAECSVIAIDRDPDALALGQAMVEEFDPRLVLLEGRFGEMDVLVRAAGHSAVDGVVMDIGVSSMQLDRPERGFSFRHDGPLSMRMDRSEDAAALTARQVVNTYDRDRLASILWTLGEERKSRQIARAIVKARVDQPIETTQRLADIVASAVPGAARAKIHPATRTFQALRIHINKELEELEAGLAAAEQLLRAGGRLAVVTFHSLEDRIAKRFFKARSGPGSRPSRHLPDAGDQGPQPSFRMVSRKPVLPGEREVSQNPRSRSAKLRIGVRTEHPAHPFDPSAPLVAEPGAA